jgi:hypothetical protein
MDTSTVELKPSKTASKLFMQARAQRHQQVRFKAKSHDEAQLRNSLQKIRTLKDVSKEDLPEDPTEPTAIGRLWGRFLELIGNR